MYKKCILCDGKFENLILNNLSMRKCVSCGLIWRTSFDLQKGHYQEKERKLDIVKIESRKDNSVQRLKIFSKYVDFNNLCDIGCGEGIFLKVALDKGYKNLIGLEPCVTPNSFAKNNGITIKSGEIDDFSVIMKNRYINTVSMFHVIEHLKNPVGSLKAIYDSIEGGTKLIIETPDIESKMMVETNYKNRLVYQEHLFYFSKHTLKELLQKTGFNIVKEGYRDFDLENISIRDLLSKVGLRKRIKISSDIEFVDKNHTNVVGVNNTKKYNSVLKKIIKKVLALAVTLLKRNDHIWIVVEKK